MDDNLISIVVHVYMYHKKDIIHKTTLNVTRSAKTQYNNASLVCSETETTTILKEYLFKFWYLDNKIGTR